MPVQRLAPGLPGHVILCSVWNAPTPSIGAVAHEDQTWLSGCTCGKWSRKGSAEFIHTEWADHLKEVQGK